MEQSSTPWRVFDTPAAGSEGEAVARGPAVQGRAAAPARHAKADLRLAIAGGIGAVAIGLVALALALSGGGSAVVDGPGVAELVGNPKSTGAAGEIVVDVAGAVVKPGVYRLATGARVGDAIKAAGGFSPRVDVDRVGVELNLAATLVDGARIRVPSRDEMLGGAGGGGGTSASGGPAGARVVNLNTATEAELDSLPGIGPVTAGKIIESRSGSPFKAIDDLRERGLLGQKALDKIRALVTVG
ncbi:MAG: ComEA family DNA-binding protein [Chloroflexi bacterium]|nr:ComEA family DNA-binding protein [Chloroflexota bacterium]